MAKFTGIPGKKDAQCDINVTPLIDVVLVLLIIFMVLTPITISEIAVNLPDKTETVEQEDDMPQDQLLLAVCLDGSMTLNRTPFEAEDLAESLKKRIRSKAKKVVFVDAHPDANYALVVAALDMARDAGAERLGMASLKEPEDFIACNAPEEPTPEDGVETPAG
jgi:biopolymer transport protein ExbD